MGRKPNNWNPIESNPSYEDLQFQSPAWYHRYSTAQSGPRLSPEAMRGIFSDKSLTWLIGDQISGAAAILLREDSD